MPASVIWYGTRQGSRQQNVRTPPQTSRLRTRRFVVRGGTTMKSIALAMFALVFAFATPAWASGTVRIQQNSGSVQTYTNVLLKIVNKTLTLTSADGVSTVVISGVDCGEI